MPQVRVGVLRTGLTSFVPFSDEDGGVAAGEALDRFVQQLRDLGFGQQQAETAVQNVATGTQTPTQAATSVTPSRTGRGGGSRTTASRRRPSAVRRAAAGILRRAGRALQGRNRNR